MVDEAQNEAVAGAYLEWNSRIALFWLTEPFADTDLYLTVTPRGLATAAWECDGVLLSPAEAEENFIGAVRGFYKAVIVDRGKEIDVLKGTDKDGLPLCLAFLALSVLAAHHMHRDDVNRATAFYPRIVQLLNLGERNKRPPGFKEQLFEELWLYVRAWTEVRSTRPLFIPAPKYRQYENYPQAHSVLRQVDIERLPDFFRWARYAPESQIAADHLRADLLRWVEEKSPFTRQGLAACRDLRLAAIVQEVAQELKAWDGSGRDDEGRQLASVELNLEIVRGMPRLSYLARKPPGFPETFDDGVHRFESLEGWYDPVPVPSNEGDALLDGFEWISIESQPRVVLRRFGMKVIAFVRSNETAGLISRRRLLAGVECGVLYHSSVATAVEAQLQTLLGTQPRSIRGAPGVPKDWFVVAPIKVEQPPSHWAPELEALEFDAVVDFFTIGGLRVGRRSTWLHGAAPILQVSGVQDSVEVNKRRVNIRSGVVEWSSILQGPGLYSVRAGRAHRNIEIVEPTITAGLPALLEGAAEVAAYLTGLPKGRWLILGAEPGEVHSCELATDDVVELSFEPIWAVPQTATKGAVIFLSSRERQATRAPRDVRGERVWARAFMDTHPLRVPLVAVDHSAKAAAEPSWISFVQIASGGAR